MRKLGVLGVALVGLAFLGSAVNQVLLPFNVFLYDFRVGGLPAWASFLVLLVPFLASAAAGLFLVTRRDWVAARLFPEPESSSPLTIDAEDLVRVGLVLVGVFLFAHAVPTLITQMTAPLVTLGMARALGEGLGASDIGRELVNSIPAYLGTIASFVVGWVLIARSRQLTARLLRLPAAVLDPEPRALASCPSCGARYDPANYLGGLSQARCAECKAPLGPMPGSTD
jgi:hypothetical protein